MATPKDYERLGAWAVMLNPDANIDRRKCHRTVPMEVLSLGFSRTGTLSMQEAYSVLGFASPYHYSSIFENIKDTDMWLDALQAKYQGKGKPFGRKEFDQLLGHCSAVTDTPCAIFWKELIEAYPEAKVVLVERDEEKWVKSVEGLISGVLDPFGRYVLRFTDPGWFGRVSNTGAAWIEGFFGSRDLKTAMANARTAYRQHNADIRAAVPKDRLLIYRLGDGWEPLCKFLGKEVPDMPFPHRNEAKTLEMAFGDLAGKALKHSAVNIVTVIGGLAITTWALYRLSAYL